MRSCYLVTECLAAVETYASLHMLVCIWMFLLMTRRASDVHRFYGTLQGHPKQAHCQNRWAAASKQCVCLTSTQKQLTFVNNRETHSSPILRPLDLSSGSQKRCSATSLAASASCSICDCFWDQIMACYIWEKCCIGQLTCRDW